MDEWKIPGRIYDLKFHEPPTSLEIHCGSKTVLRFDHDGFVHISSELKTEEAATDIWRALLRIAVQHNERLANYLDEQGHD